MTALILKSKPVVHQIKSSLKNELLSSNFDKVPKLAVVLVGDDAASHIYIKHKQRACEEIGFESQSHLLPENTSEKALFSLIQQLNHDASISGILVQLPLPAHIDTKTIVQSIDPRKDVDGFHSENLGRLAQGYPSLRPCTPFGIITLLQHYKINLHGANALVIGASNIVGRPMLLELLNQKATVSISHRATRELQTYVNHADIIVVATGVYDVVKTDWLNKNQVIIDVGIHRTNDGCITGDINYNQAKDKVAAITPVPGGVGPMTVAALMQNTWHAFKNQLS